jgi:hypothetical protein
MKRETLFKLVTTDRGRAMVDQRKVYDRAIDMVAAVDDLQIPDQPPANGSGTAAHRALFDRYVEALDEARETASAWWEALIEVETERTNDRDEAIATVGERHPGGPVAHKFVIAALRQTWLACQELNRGLPPINRVRPVELVLSWLLHQRREDLAEFLGGLVYWPLGLDKQGTWI